MGAIQGPSSRNNAMLAQLYRKSTGLAQPVVQKVKRITGGVIDLTSNSPAKESAVDHPDAEDEQRPQIKLEQEDSSLEPVSKK